MSNYSEELAYWYLRLNGFFPITNFVFHSIKEEGDKRFSRADADVLAIRPPNVTEVIKEEELGLDDKIISGYEKSRYVFVYCEVKTSEYKVKKLFPTERIKYVFKRFGLDPNAVTEEPKIFIGTKIFKKIFIANKPKKNADKKAIFIPLDSTIEFIMGRFVHYDEYKYPSRMFFNSSLIQQFIHCADKMNK